MRPQRLSPNCCATEPESFRAWTSEWHPVSAPGAEIKPVIYCTSIRQRERKCFRQINSWRSDIIESGQQLSACLHDISSCCQIHVSPNVICRDKGTNKWAKKQIYIKKSPLRHTLTHTNCKYAMYFQTFFPIFAMILTFKGQYIWSYLRSISREHNINPYPNQENKN